MSDRPADADTTVDPTAARVEPVAADALADDVSAASFGGYVRLWWQGIRAGELGSLPIIVGLVVIVVVFGILDDTFLTERNFTNLLLQMSAIATIAIGVVFVLLIGEIDLSVAFVSAVGGVVMTLLLRPEDPGWAWWAAILVALICTTAIGFVQALVITKAGVPSFVVTLAGLLIWSGVVLILTTQASSVGTIRIQDETAVGIANDFLSSTAGWVVAALVVIGYALSELQNARTRRASGLYAKPIVVTVLQTVGLAAVTFAAVWYVNKDRGVPKVTVILLALLVFWSFIASRTRFGRHVYAVGGSAEASRRAGIDVDRVRIAGLHDQRLHGRCGRDHARLAPPLGGDQQRRREPASARHRVGGHRRHEPLRGRRPGRVRPARGARDRVDPERDGPSWAGVRHEVRHHGARPARGRARGRVREAPPCRARRRLTAGSRGPRCGSSSGFSSSASSGAASAATRRRLWPTARRTLFSS